MFGALPNSKQKRHNIMCLRNSENEIRDPEMKCQRQRPNFFRRWRKKSGLQHQRLVDFSSIALDLVPARDIA